jgi:hypothetical protein
MRARSIVAGVLVLVGLVWIGQGLGLIRSSSFMTDDLRWAIIGAGMIVAGAAMAAIELRSRAKP